jgi:hypothetical protein
MAIARLLLVAPVAVSIGMTLPTPARAISMGPVHLGNRIVVADNWVDNASAPATRALGACTPLVAALDVRHAGHSTDNGMGQERVSPSPFALVKVAAEAVAVVRLIADLPGMHSAFRSLDR